MRMEVLAADGVEVEVERRDVRNFNLRVRADGSVHLSMPRRASDAQARDFLERHARWIRRHRERRLLAASEGGRVPERTPLWGRMVDTSELLSGRGAPDGDPGAARRAIDLVYRDEVARRLPGTARPLEEAMGVRASGWSVRSMRTRWGSCTPARGTIRINAALAAYPERCLAFVVAHELTHLIEPSHGERFHRLLDGFCPGNREAARILRLPAEQVAAAGGEPLP